MGGTQTDMGVQDVADGGALKLSQGWGLPMPTSRGTVREDVQCRGSLVAETKLRVLVSLS